MNTSATPEIVKYFVSNMSNKKSSKIVSAMIAQASQSFGDAFEMRVFFAVAESVDWKEAIDSAGKDSNKIQFLSKELKNLTGRRNFSDFFAPAFSESACRAFWTSNFREVMKVLKLAPPADFLVVCALAFGIERPKNEPWVKLLATLLSELAKAQKPLDFAPGFVAQLAQNLKDNIDLFPNSQRDLTAFFETYVQPLRDQKLFPLLTIGAPELAPFDPKPAPPELKIERDLSLRDLMKESGPSVMNISAIQQVLREAGQIKELDYLRCLMLIIEEKAGSDKTRARPDPLLADAIRSLMYDTEFRITGPAKEVTSWDPEAFLKGVHEVVGKKISYDQVMLAMAELKDSSAPFFENKKFVGQLFGLLTALQKLSNFRVPQNLFSVPWQSSLCKGLLLLSILDSKETSLFFPQDLFPSKIEVGEGPQTLSNLSLRELNFWSVKEPVTLAIELCDVPQIAARMKQMVDSIIKGSTGHTIEALFFVLILISPKRGVAFHRELIKTCFNYIFNSSNSMIGVVEQFYNMNKRFFISIMAELNESENSFMFLSKILDFSQNTKNFQAFFLSISSSAENHYFSISLSLLAIKREFLRLENWIENNLKNGQIRWIEDFLRYVNRNIFVPLRDPKDLANRRKVEDVLEKSQFTINNLAIIFENYLLKAGHFCEVSPSNQEKIKAIHEKLVKIYPELSQAAVKAPDIKANDLLEKLIYGTMSIDDFIDRLSKFKSSAKNKDHEILSCIIINLINEYRFFKEFPDKELKITAETFGKMVKNKIVDGRSLVIFLKGLTDAMEVEAGKNMFEFGLTGISQFVLDMDLNLSADFYKQLFANEKLRERHFDLLYELSRKLNQAGKLDSIPSEHLRIVNQNKQQSLPNRRDFDLPSAEERRHQDRTLIEHLTRLYNELIEGESGTESDMDSLTFFLNMLDPNRLDSKINDFDSLLLQKGLTSRFSKYLVYKRVATENNLLGLYMRLVSKSKVKNLYKTVYRDTLAMLNVVIDHINAKEVLLPEEKNCMKYCAKWGGLITFGLNQPIQLKYLNLKQKVYEAVERKKMLNIITFMTSLLGTINESDFFKPRVPCINALFDLLSEVNKLSFIGHTGQVFIELLFNDLKVNQKEIHEFNWLASRHPSDMRIRRPGPSDIASNVRIDLGRFTEADLEGKFHVDIRTIVASAIDASLNDVRTALINRTLKNTLETTKILVLKDFCMESSEIKLMEAAQNMIINLTLNLAMITTREPVRVKMQEQLGNLLRVQSELDDQTRKIVKDSLVTANLDVACACLKKLVIDISLKEIARDPEILDECRKRKAAKDSRRPFTHDNFQKLHRDLPKLLKPKMDSGDLDCVEIYSTQLMGVPERPISVSEQGNQIDSILGGNEEDFEFDYIKAIEEQLRNPSSEEQLSNYQKIKNSIIAIIQKSKNSEVISKKIAISLFKFLPSQNPNLVIDVLVACLSYCPKLPSTIIQWLFEDDNFLNANLIIDLLQKSLINYLEFDERYSQKLQIWSEPTLNCIVEVLKHVIINEKILSLTSLPKIVKQLQECSKRSEFNSLSEETFLFIKSICNYLENQTPENQMRFQMVNQESQFNRLNIHIREFFETKNEGMFSICAKFLEDWLNIRSLDEGKKLIETGLPKDLFNEQKNHHLFFTYLFDICVTGSQAERVNPVQQFQTLNYTLIDPLTKCFILFSSFSSNKKLNQHYLESIILATIINLTKNHNYQTETPFNPKIYFRVLNALLVLTESEESLEIGKIFIEGLNILNPIKYPKFAFAWLKLISAKELISLLGPHFKEFSNEYAILILKLIAFYREIFTPEMLESIEIRTFYIATLRLFLVLQNDYPDFLIENSFVFLEELPAYFKHLRNIILATHPKNIKIPIPFNSITEANTDFGEVKKKLFCHQRIELRINSYNVHLLLNNYIRSRNSDDNQSILSQFYNIGFNEKPQIILPLLRSVVFYLPYLVYRFKDSSSQVFTSYKAQSFSFFTKIFKLGYCELNDKLISAMLDNLTYPNDITFYFIELLMLLFGVHYEERLVEQLLKNIFDRLMVDKPHPWGVLHLFGKFISRAFPLIRKRINNKETELMIEKMIRIAGNYIQITNLNEAITTVFAQ